jgi:hypothetical protein
MDYDVIEARHVRGHVVWLRFRDGTQGEIDLGPALNGPVFEPLKDEAYFRTFSIDPRFCTLRWSGQTAPTSRQNASTTTAASRRSQSVPWARRQG